MTYFAINESDQIIESHDFMFKALIEISHNPAFKRSVQKKKKKVSISNDTISITEIKYHLNQLTQSNLAAD